MITVSACWLKLRSLCSPPALALQHGSKLVTVSRLVACVLADPRSHVGFAMLKLRDRVDLLRASLPKGLLNQLDDQMRASDCTYTLGTFCSGIDGVVPLADAVSELIASEVGKPFKLQHIFSCESDEQLQKSIMKRRRPNLLFDDISCMGEDTCYDVTSESRQWVPMCDVAVAGVSCKSASRLNVNYKSLTNAVLERSDSTGRTVEGLRAYVARHRPRLVIVENVLSLGREDDTDGTNNLSCLVKRFTDLGYTVVPQQLRAYDLGEPVSRGRWYILMFRGREPATVSQSTQATASLTGESSLGSFRATVSPTACNRAQVTVSADAVKQVLREARVPHASLVSAYLVDVAAETFKPDWFHSAPRKRHRADGKSNGHRELFQAAGWPYPPDMSVLLAACPTLDADHMGTLTVREQEVLFYIILVRGQQLPAEGSGTVLCVNLQHSIARCHVSVNSVPCILPNMSLWVITETQQRKMIPQEALALQGWRGEDLNIDWLEEANGDVRQRTRFWMQAVGNAFHSGSIAAALLVGLAFAPWGWGP